MKFRLGAARRETFNVRVMCDALGVSPAGITHGVPGLKVRARRPIVPCWPGSVGRGRYGARDPRGLALRGYMASHGASNASCGNTPPPVTARFPTQPE